MKIANDIFIKRPMRWNYNFSIFLEIIIVILFMISLQHNLSNWEQWSIIGAYSAISSIYYFINRKDRNYHFISVSKQLEGEYNPIFGKYFLNSVLTLTKYIFMMTIFQDLFKDVIIQDVKFFIDTIFLIIILYPWC